MRHEFGSLTEPGVLTPTIPQDIGARSIRQRILAAMARSCAERTFAGTTIGDIVADAGVSRATFYKHFENKRECFDAAAEEFLVELRSVAADAAGSDSASASDATRDGVEALLRRLSEKPTFAKLLLVEAPNVNPSMVPRCRDLVVEAMGERWRQTRTAKRPGADPGIAFGRANILLAEHLSSDGNGDLTALLPELVYVALLPYIGQDKALELAGRG
jgi:AcrR family transcriptional regulator